MFSKEERREIEKIVEKKIKVYLNPKINTEVEMDEEEQILNEIMDKIDKYEEFEKECDKINYMNDQEKLDYKLNYIEKLFDTVEDQYKYSI